MDEKFDHAAGTVEGMDHVVKYRKIAKLIQAGFECFYKALDPDNVPE